MTTTAAPLPAGSQFGQSSLASPAWIGLGANLGEPAAHLRTALAGIGALPGTRVLRVSPLYRSAPVGAGGPDYVNAVAEISTRLAPQQLLDALQALEQAAGRERPYRNAPRTLDLDLLLYGDAVIDAPGLRVPHPHLHERAFALVPLLDVWPDARIPGYGDARDAVSALEMSNIHPL